MALTFSTLARNTIGDSLARLIDQGNQSESGYFEIRTGPKPANVQLPASGELLAVHYFSNPSFMNFINGVGDSYEITNDTNIKATGQAGWFRIYNRNKVAILDGTISISGGGGDIRFNNIDFIAGGSTIIPKLQLVQPE